MSSAAFFIQTPFEMICAVNAVHNYDISDYKFYLIKDNQGRLIQLTGIADHYNIDYSIVPFEFVRRGGLKRAVIESLMFRSGNFDMVFTGDYRAALTDIYTIPFLGRRGRMIKLDDGSCTINMLTDNNSSLSSSIKCNRWWLWLVSKIKSIDITYYTVFDNIKNDRYHLEINDMKFLQSCMNSNGESKEIMFIGTVPESYIDGLGISIDDYYTFLRKVFMLLKEKEIPVKYILHGRDTNPRTIEMCKEYGFDCFKPQESIESYVVRNSYCPEYIYGLSSTALFSLKKILGQVKVVNIVPQLDPIIAKSLYAIGDYYVANGIEMIKLSIND